MDAKRPYLFVAIGGSGSTQLIDALSMWYDVGNKPDTVFRLSIPELHPGEFDLDQDRIRCRAPNFSEVEGESIDEFLIRYVGFLRMHPMRTAVFNTCAEVGLFSKHAIGDVVFLIRHPLHAYASWAKQERHGDTVNGLGGINSETPIRLFARRWASTVEEAFRLRAAGILGGVVRFEHAREDVRQLAGLEWVFENWDCSRRNFGVLAPRGEGLLKSLTISLTKELYGAHDYWTPTF
jgi:hypothetical protein